jgi:hypothetical protein
MKNFWLDRKKEFEEKINKINRLIIEFNYKNSIFLKTKGK